MLAPLALLAIAYVAMPTHVFTAYGVDQRLPLALALLLAGALRWGEVTPRRAVRMLAVLALVVLVQVAGITVSWVASRGDTAALMAVIDRIPPGSRVAVAYPHRVIGLVNRPVLHFPLYAVIRRAAFVPTLFAYPTQQPVTLQPDWVDAENTLLPPALWARFVDGGAAVEQAVLGRYDMVIFLDNREVRVPPDPLLEEVAGAGRFRLFRLVRPRG